MALYKTVLESSQCKPHRYDKMADELSGCSPGPHNERRGWREHHKQLGAGEEFHGTF